MAVLPNKICLFLTAPPQIASSARHTGFPLYANFYLPEKCSTFPSQIKLPDKRILVSTAISGGTLSWYLKETVRRYGLDSVLPLLERTSMDFPLPSPTGTGTPLSQAQLQRKITYYSPSIHFSPPLYAQYFLYQDGEQRTHFVLFDDPASFRRKLALLRTLGFRSAVASYPQIQDWIEEMKGWEELSSQPE